MENNFDNIPNEQSEQTAQQEQNTNASDSGSESRQYTDPDAGMNSGYTQSYYGGGGGYQQTGQSQNYGNTSYQQQYQDNYNYNVGSNTGYNQGYEDGMDNSPLSMGEWILTLLLMSIPCVNIIMCCVWGIWKERKCKQTELLPRRADFYRNRRGAVSDYGYCRNGYGGRERILLLLKNI